MIEQETDAVNADIIIVGAGLVGLAAAIAFTLQQKNVVLVSSYQPIDNQATSQSVWDERVYTLTPATENWLENLGVWENIDKTRVSSIDAMHIWNADRELLLKSEDANLAKMGLIVENQNVMNALWQKVQALGVTVITDAECVDIEQAQAKITLSLHNKSVQNKSDKNLTEINAKLLIAADGIHSWVRQKLNIGLIQKSYQQTAIVANFLAEKPHNNIARQWFNPHETLALLPLPDNYVSMVWSLSTEQAAELLNLSNNELSDRVQFQAKHILGALEIVGQVKSIELHQKTTTQLIAERVVIIGDAAHQIHPMAGQGVNLGFRDVMKLTALSTKLQSMHDIGETGFLRQYERARKADVSAMNYLTSGLDYLFASEQTLLKKLTQFGLQQINRQAGIKKILINQAVS